MELRDADLSSGSVKVDVKRHAASQQLLQNVVVRQLSDTEQPDIFILHIMVTVAHNAISYSLMPEFVISL